LILKAKEIAVEIACLAIVLALAALSFGMIRLLERV
jgi:hypothetical protein